MSSTPELVSLVPPASAATAGAQLRRYRVRDGEMDNFVALWRDQLVPLRKTFGFEPVGAWVLADTNEFVWVVRHDGDFAAAEQAYYASPERALVNPAPKTLLEQTANWMMTSCYDVE